MYRRLLRDDEVLDSMFGNVTREGRCRELWAVLEEASELVGGGGLIDNVFELVPVGDMLEDAID